MDTPSKDRVRMAVFDIVLAVVVEEVAAKTVRRLRYGRPCPECGAANGRRRPLRRLCAAVLAELAMEGADKILSERRRMRLALDNLVAAETEAASRARRAQIPQQRRAPETTGAPVTGNGADPTWRPSPATPS